MRYKVYKIQNFIPLLFVATQDAVRGGSRIPRRRRRQPSRRRQHYDFAEFSKKKLHELRKFWA